MANGHPPWTPEEDAIILSARSIDEAHGRLPSRTRAATKQRQHKLRHPEPKAIAVFEYGKHLWTHDEKKLLARRYESADSIEEVCALLPRFTRRQIASKAHVMGLKRWFNGAADVPVTGHKELIDQIRIRSKQDGIPLYKLDKLLGSGHYFGASQWRRTRINLVHVAHAIEYFGGTLVIDWCDR